MVFNITRMSKQHIYLRARSSKIPNPFTWVKYFKDVDAAFAERFLNTCKFKNVEFKLERDEKV